MDYLTETGGEDIYDSISISEFGMLFDALGPNEKDWVYAEIENDHYTDNGSHSLQIKNINLLREKLAAAINPRRREQLEDEIRYLQTKIKNQ